MRRLSTFIVALVLGLGLGIAGHSILGTTSLPHDTVDAATSKETVYQCAMHPWIKSDKPGRCTICGMELTPAEDATPEAMIAGEHISLRQSQIQALGVKTESVRIQPLTRTLQVAGMIDDDATRHRILSAYVDGRIDKLHLNYLGADVAENQPLANIYSPMLLQATEEYRRTSGEFKSNALSRLRQLGLRESQIEDLNSDIQGGLTMQILSPMAGTVVKQEVYEGQYVMTGDPLFELADFSVMWFNFRIYEQDLPWIMLGQTVAVTTPSQPGKTYSGPISFIDPNLDDMSRSTIVRVELPNPLVNGRRELLHRLYADGMVAIDIPDVMTVPRSAIISTGPESVVYVDQGNGIYERVLITLGRRGDTLIEVLSGLKEGDKVVISGNLLMDGQAEMNRSYSSETTAVTAPPSDTEKPTVDFINFADALAAALANDDLEAFNHALHSAPSNSPSDTPTHAADLASARRAFLEFTQIATAAVAPFQGMEGAPAFTLWECPMVDDAIPGAPTKVRWIQSTGRPIGNPFFGAEMKECGVEVKP